MLVSSPVRAHCLRRYGVHSMALVLSTALCAAERVELRVAEPAGASRYAEDWPVIVGVALPKGALSDLRRARVVNARGEEVLSQLEAACYWEPAKQSVKWLLADTLVQLRGERTEPLYLELGAGVQRSRIESPLVCEETDDFFRVCTGRIQVRLSKWAFRLFGDVRLDADGDGAYSDAESLLAGDDDGGIFWVDQDGVRYDAARDDHAIVWEVEKQGPVRVTLRCEGWFIDASGKKVMKQITRFRFHPYADWVRVYQTFVWTAGAETEIKQITMRSKLATAASDARFGIDGRSVSTGASVRLLQDSYSSATWSTDGTQSSGQRWSGWLESCMGHGRVVAVIRDCAEQQPKGFEIAGDRLDLHLYPPRATPLSVKEEARLTRQHRKNPRWTRSRQYSFDPKSPYRYVPTGFAKTHEIVYRFLRASAPDTAAETTNDLAQRPVVAYADPKKTCAARPLGVYIPPRNPKQWPWEERFLDAVYRWGGLYDEEMDQYEILNFGDVIWNRGPGRSAAHYRYWGNQSKGWVNAPWYLFARSGDRYYAIRGEQHARHVMDVDTVTYGARQGTWVFPRVIGAQWQYCSVHFGWTACLIGHWPNHDYLYLCYYLTGYERAQRMAREVETSILASDYDKPATGGLRSIRKETADGEVVPFDPSHDRLGEGERVAGFSRGHYNAIWQFSVMAMNSGDERFLRLARWYQQVALLNVDEQGRFRANYMNLDKSQVWHHLATGDEATAESLVRHTRGHIRRSLLFLAYAHQLTKDKTLLKEAASRLWILSRATDYGQDSFNRGAFGGGTQAAGNTLFLGALATLGQMELAPHVEAECPRGLMIDGGPAEEGTGAKTGKYVRVAYVLEQKDGAIDLDVELAGGHQWDMPVDLRVLDPFGKEVAHKQMAPRVDRKERAGVPSGSGPYTLVTRWRVTVPPDGVNGVYVLRLVGRQKKGSWHNGFTLRITSSTAKLVWYIPQPAFAIRGSGGGLFFRPRADAKYLGVKQGYCRPPHVVRLYDPTGQEVGNTESLGPDPNRDMAMTPRAIRVAVDDRRGVWSITAAVTYLMRLHLDGTMPFYSLSREEWFDPTQHDGVTRAPWIQD